MILFFGTTCKALLERVTKEIREGIEIGKIERKQFPDSEIYIRILSDVKGEDCVVIQSIISNDSFVELILLLDTLNDLGAKSIHSVIPYLGYSRQDKRFLPGEAISAKTILKIIAERCNKITTVNGHFFNESGEKEYEGIKVNNLTAFPILAEYFKEISKRENIVLIAPDKGALKYTKEAASILRCEFDYLEKKRISPEEVEIRVKNLDVFGKSAIILDDIISTGGTMIKAVELLKSEGVNKVYVGCVHGVLIEGLEKVSKFADGVVCTDSIYREKFSKVSLSKIIVKNLGI